MTDEERSRAFLDGYKGLAPQHSHGAYRKFYDAGIRLYIEDLGLVGDEATENDARVEEDTDAD